MYYLYLDGSLISESTELNEIADVFIVEILGICRDSNSYRIVLNLFWQWFFIDAGCSIEPHGNDIFVVDPDIHIEVYYDGKRA